jgi:hypothetical protein
MISRLLFCLCGLTVLCWADPQPAYAYIGHWDPREGFFVRQFAYLFFLAAMLFFIFELKAEKLPRYRGFKFLALAGGLLALWNLDCFVGQLLALNLNPPTVGPPGPFSQGLVAADAATWFLYFTKLDHLVLAPAFLLLYLGIKDLARS